MSGHGSVRVISLAACAATLAACGFSVSTGSSIDANGDGPGAGRDAAPDVLPPTEDAMPDGPAATWGAPQPLGISGEDPTLSSDLLQIWYVVNGDIYHASRPTRFVAFETPGQVFELSTAAIEGSPEVSPDGMQMMFARTLGNSDLYVTKLGMSTWGTPQSLLDVNTTDHEQSPSFSDDQLMLAFTRNAPAALADIYITTRASTNDPWTTPVRSDELSSSAQEGSVFLSGDKLVACFDSQRGGVQSDLYCASRSSATAPFSTPVALTELNSPQSDQDPWLSADGKLIIFWSDRDGSGKLYFSFRP